MGLMRRLRANLRAARQIYQRLRDRGYGWLAVILWRLPQAAAVRGYRKLAYAINDGVLQRWVTPARFRRFQSLIDDQLGGHFYVIVMPQTLHFVLPCLRLVVQEATVILLLNGVRQWEADLLRARFPNLAQFRIATLPNSSVGHGSMINLLLRHNDRDFGLLDHDLYLFDKSVLRQLRFADEEFLLCLLSDASVDSKWIYPLTHFLYFRVAVFRRLMERYGVGAQSYRRVPEPARSRLAALGLGDGETMKSYHDFFDTLHVLIGLAYADGLEVAQLEMVAEDGVYHIGGTSVGTHHTKDLAHLYIHLRFLEFADEPLLLRRYASVAAPFSSAAQVLRLVPATTQALHRIRLVNALIDRLRSTLLSSKPAARG